MVIADTGAGSAKEKIKRIDQRTKLKRDSEHGWHQESTKVGYSTDGESWKDSKLVLNTSNTGL